MKLSFLVLLSLLLSVRAVPSKAASHAHTRSMKNGFVGDSFVGEIKHRSFAAFDRLDIHPQIELLSDHGEHSYKDFSTRNKRYRDGGGDGYEYEAYDDIIPEELRVSGQSLETEDINDYKSSNGDKPNHGRSDKNEKETTRELVDDIPEEVRVSGQSVETEDINDYKSNNDDKPNNDGNDKNDEETTRELVAEIPEEVRVSGQSVETEDINDYRSNNDDKPNNDRNDKNDEETTRELVDGIPDELRVSGQSVETEDINDYKSNNDDKRSNGGKPNNDGDDNNDKNGSTRELVDDEQETNGENEYDEVGCDPDEAGEDIEDITVKGQSDYSYLVGDMLHGLNEIKAAGVMNGGEKVMFDAEDDGLVEVVRRGAKRHEEVLYNEMDEEGSVDDGNYGYHDRYGYMDDDVTVKGQAIEHESDDDVECEDYDDDDDDEIVDDERFEDEDWEDGDDYEEFVNDDETYHDVHSADLDKEDDYYNDPDEEYEDDDEEYSMREAEEEKATDRHVKGMSVKEQDGVEEFEKDDEALDEELAEDMDGIDRQDDEDEDYGYDDEFDDDEEDDEWDEEDNEIDPALRYTDENVVDTEDMGSEDRYSNLYGDGIKAGGKTGKSK